MHFIISIDLLNFSFFSYGNLSFRFLRRKYDKVSATKLGKDGRRRYVKNLQTTYFG